MVGNNRTIEYLSLNKPVLEGRAVFLLREEILDAMVVEEEEEEE